MDGGVHDLRPRKAVLGLQDVLVRAVDAEDTLGLLRQPRYGRRREEDDIAVQRGEEARLLMSSILFRTS